MAKIGNYLSLVKFSHTVFALPFALIGFSLGTLARHGLPDWMLLVKVILCMVFARTAAMAFNRFIDRDIDARNARTQQREIPSGILSPGAVLLLVLLSSMLFVLTTYFINPICFYLSPIALAVVLGYSYTKRFTWLCHVVLGIGLGLAPIGAYLAVTGAFSPTPLYFSLAVLTWVSGFDVIYALQDEDFDRQQALQSIPVFLGKAKALRVSEALHLLSALFILMAGFHDQRGILYWIGCAIFIGLLILQHRLVKPNDLSKVNVAFFTTNGIASVVFAVFVLADLFLYPATH